MKSSLEVIRETLTPNVQSQKRKDSMYKLRCPVTQKGQHVQTKVPCHSEGTECTNQGSLSLFQLFPVLLYLNSKALYSEKYSYTYLAGEIP